jgi:hypothetical protein
VLAVAQPLFDLLGRNFAMCSGFLMERTGIEPVTSGLQS